MENRRVRYIDEARVELTEAFEWYRQRSPRAAAAFLAELDHAAASISEAPEAWPFYELETRRYVLSRFPFDVVFRVVSEGVEVVAVAHHRRRPGYWRLRRES